MDPLVLWEASPPIQIKNKNKHNNTFSFFSPYSGHIVNLNFIDISFNFLSKYSVSVIIVFIVFLDEGPLEKQLLLKGHPP